MDHSSVTVRTLEDLALAAPAMLGYWPDKSLCIVVVDHDDRVLFIMRWPHDEVDSQAMPPPVTLPEGGPGPPTPAAFHLVTFPASRDGAPGLELAPGFLDAGLPRGQALLVVREDDGIAWIPVEAAASGDAVEQRMSGPEVAARIRRWGLPRWQESRAAYVGDIETSAEEVARVREALTAHPGLVESQRDEAITRLYECLSSGPLTAHTIAELLMSLADIPVRDTLIWEVMHDDPGTWVALAERLVGVVAAAPDSHVAPPATVLAIVRWQMGDGSRASAAVDRALAADPDYSLARLVDRCLAVGLHPATWREGLAELSRAECRRSA